MSSTIWTRCEGLHEVRDLERDAWRVVEDQFQSSTMKLVDTVEEQAVLEQIIDDAKPPVPTDPEFRGLHFLLFTPFRYPPFHLGSRFARAHERGLWYGATRIETALIEKAFYRFVFLLGVEGDLGNVEQAWSAFSVRIATPKGVDLTAPPFAAYRAQISSATTYAHSQPLGSAMRDDEVVATLFTSARDKGGGTNVALFRPAFASPSVAESAHVGWMSRVNTETIQIYRKNHAPPATTVREYRRQYFEIDGIFPMPSIRRP